jgi:hypothetical protein
MKRTLAAALFVFVLVTTLAPDAHAIGAYGIWWMPDDSDDDGFGLGIKDRRNLTPMLAVDGRVSYVWFSTPDASLIPVEATGLVSLGVWYGGAGVGYYFATGDLEDEFGWYALLGLEFGVGPVSVFGEVKWQDLKPDLDGGGTANLDSIVIHVGATLAKLLKR